MAEKHALFQGVRIFHPLAYRACMRNGSLKTDKYFDDFCGAFGVAVRLEWLMNLRLSSFGFFGFCRLSQIGVELLNKNNDLCNDFFGFLYGVQENERKSLEDGGAKMAWRTVSFSDRQ
jgi:hypothetical protein